MQDDETALTWAVRYGYANVARFLLENGATMDFENKVRRTDMIIIILYLIILGLGRIIS
jgi:ankyrin repeat protein